MNRLMDCNECEYLSPTEDEQNKMNNKPPHFCKLLNQRVYHAEKHPILKPLQECPINKVEEEIKERVKFKLNDIFTCIKQAINRNTKFAYDFTLSGDLNKGIKCQHYREAFEQLREIFEKETILSIPYDDMAIRAQKKQRNKAVDEIMNLMHPSGRRKVNSVVRIIEECLEI